MMLAPSYERGDGVPLWSKILFGPATLVGVAVLCTSVLFLLWQQAALRRQIELRAGTLACSLADQGQFALLVEDADELKRMADFALASNPDVLYVAAEGPQGKTVLAAARTGLPLPPPPAIRAATIRHLWLKAGPECVEAAAPAVVRPEHDLFSIQSSHESLLGTIRIGVSLEAQRKLYAATVRYVATIGVLIFLVAFVIEHFQTRQRRAQARLQQMEERLESIIMLSPAVLYTAQAERGGLAITFMGDNSIEVLGFAPEAFAAPGFFWGRIHPEDLEGVRGAVATLKGEQHIAEYRFLHSSGRYRWIQDHRRVLRDASGGNVEFIGSLFDVTERKEGEQALRRSEQRYRDLTEMLPQTVFECDSAGRVTFINQSGLDAFGLTRAELERGVGALDLLDPAERRRGAEGLRARLAGEVSDAHEYLMRRRDGTRFPGAVYSAPVFNEGRTVGVRGLLIDISDRKQAEEALREWAMLVQSSDDAIIKELGGRIAFWNTGAEQIFGYRAEEIVGRPLEDIIPPENRGDFRQVVARLDRGEAVAHFPTYGVGKDGRRIDTSLSVMALRDAEGGLAGSIGIMRDMSEIQAKRRELLKRNSLLELLQASAVAANQAASAEEAIQTCLDNICSHTGWSVGHAFVMSEGVRSGLTSSGLWHFDDPQGFDQFREISEELVIQPGVGLGGRVLATGRPYWVADLAQDPGLARGKLAADLGLKAAFASPILAGAEVAGVMEFFSAAPVEADDPFLQAIHSIGVQLGRMIERTRAGKALRESEARYRAITENASHGVLTMNPEGRIVYANRTCEALLGYSCAELLDMYVSDLGPERSRGLVRRWLRRLTLRSAANFSLAPFEATGWHKTGQERPLEVSLTGYLDKVDARVCTAVIRDISERKRAEEEARKATETLRAVVENSPLAILTLDREGTVRSWNRAAEQLFGWPREEALGLPLPTVPDAADPHYRAGLERVLGGKTAMYEVRRIRKDGSFVEVGAWGAPLRDGDGAITGLIVEYVDLTERKRLEAQLRQAQKLESIGQLAAGLAHEINTPIQYVGDNAHFLDEAFGEITKLLEAYDGLLAEARAWPTGQQVARAIDDLAEKADFAFLRQEIPKAIHESLEGVGRVARIVGAMKAFSHPGPAEFTTVDLNRAIESTILVCRNEWKYVADMVTELDSSLSTVPCLPGEINQVILNLIINAAHAIADVVEPRGGKGTITVSTRSDGDWAEIRVRDTGTGIPPEVRPRIFDPFFTTKEVGKGTGQGLALSHSIVVQKHGGTIHFETEVGNGTVFVIRLPLRREAEV